MTFASAASLLEPGHKAENRHTALLPPRPLFPIFLLHRGGGLR